MPSLGVQNYTNTQTRLHSSTLFKILLGSGFEINVLREFHNLLLHFVQPKPGLGTKIYDFINHRIMIFSVSHYLVQELK